MVGFPLTEDTIIKAPLINATLQINDRNGDRDFQEGEEGPLLSSFGGSITSLDPDLRQPYTDEWSAGIDSEIGKNLRLSALFIYRRERDLLGITNLGVPFSAYSPVQALDIGEDGRAGTADDRPSQVDQAPIKAQLLLPLGYDPKKKYPAIVHTHQAAIYQEVYLGPGPQKDNVAWYGFHQWLAQEGYVVLNVDYRGSYGYGRDFRVGDSMDLGGDDARDVISGVEYLKTLGYVDENRIGVYGMSYGGHMVLSLLTKFPEVFKAGVDIAGVADFPLNYESLYGPWILGRLGTPEENPEAYYRASAINFIERMKAPLLILHGTNDPNVTLLQSVLLVDRLLKQGKRFEFEIYPGELHFFTKKRSWVDAFAKMARFFDQNLGRLPGSARTTDNPGSH